MKKNLHFHFHPPSGGTNTQLVFLTERLVNDELIDDGLFLWFSFVGGAQFLDDAFPPTEIPIEIRSNSRSHSRRLTDRARAALTDDEDEGLPSFGSRRFSPGVVREIENADDDDDDAHRKHARERQHSRRRIETDRLGADRFAAIQQSSCESATEDVVSVRTGEAGDCRKRSGKGSVSDLVGARVLFGA